MQINSITENVLLRDTHTRLRANLKSRFPELSKCRHDDFLALAKYVSRTPHRFFSEDIYAYFLAWLQDHDARKRTELQQYISANESELSGALLHLEEINQLNWHDHLEKLDDYELIRFIDQDIHPMYLRLVEAVQLPFLRLAAHFSRQDRNKGTDSLDIWSVVEELKGSSLEVATDAYRHIVRNGIAHGGITYLQKEIRYRDKKGNEEILADSDMIRLFDNMIDACNALSLALSIFLLTNHQFGYMLPRQLLLDELRAETKTPWWEIVGCTPSEFAGLNQLIVYARPRTSDYGKVQISTFHSGVLAEKYAPGYDRYFFSIRSHNSWPGWAAFNGKKLHQLRHTPNACLEDYKGVVEDDLVFYVPRWKVPRIVSKFQTFWFSICLHWPGAMADFREHIGWPNLIVRQAKIHRNSWGCVLNGSVYIQSKTGMVNQETVRKACRRIVMKSLVQARRSLSPLNPLRYLPLSFAQVNVFRKDYRRRRLASFGLESDLIATVRIQRISRIKVPDIAGSMIEQKGRYRIAWNKAWLEDTGANDEI